MIPLKVKRILAAHGLSEIEFEPGSTPTSEMAAARLGVAVGQIAKSMLLKGKNGNFYLVVCPGDRRISSKKVKAETGTRIRMARADETESVTGYRPGGVCPFGLDKVEILIDESLSRYPTIYPAAGTDASGVPLTFDQLRVITGGRVANLMEE